MPAGGSTRTDVTSTDVTSTDCARVLAVCADAAHAFSKPLRDVITLHAGLGVAGDAHHGSTVQHRSHAARDPHKPNLRQVHLLHAELFDELAAQGFHLQAGALGENITTRGVNLLALPLGTRLHVGGEAVLRLTGLRNPCRQIEAFQRGLLDAVLPRDANGNVRRKTGVMAVVERGGSVRAGDAISVALPAGDAVPLAPV